MVYRGTFFFNSHPSIIMHDRGVPRLRFPKSLKISATKKGQTMIISKVPVSQSLIQTPEGQLHKEDVCGTKCQ